MTAVATGQQHPRIKGDWMSADSSQNHLELAPTEEAGIYAVRDTFHPEELLFATGSQLLKLAESVQSGRMRTLVR